MEKVREFQKNIYFCFNDYVSAFDCMDHNKLQKIVTDMNSSVGKWSQSVQSQVLWSNSSSLLISRVVLGHLLALASFLVEQSYLGCGCEQAWPHHSRPGPTLAVSPQPILHSLSLEASPRMQKATSTLQG